MFTQDHGASKWLGQDPSPGSHFQSLPPRLTSHCDPKDEGQGHGKLKAGEG